MGGPKLQQDGAVRPTAHLLHLPRPVPNPKAATMPTQLLPRPLHGRTGGLCQETGQMPRVSCGAQDPLQRDPGLPDQLHSPEVPRAPFRDHWRATRPQCRCHHVEVCGLFREDICKDAHNDILKREISRVNNQIKRGMNRIEDALEQVERNQQQLKTNADTVCGEIDEIQRRLTLALKERTDYLKSSVDKYVGQEMKSLKELKDNLDLEVTNIRSNSDLMEKNLDDGTKWDDIELLDCKEIFIKMMDWIRNYDTSNEQSWEEQR